LIAQPNTEQDQIVVKNILFTWSNLISLTRVFIAAPIIYLHYTNGGQITLPIILLVFYGIFSDYLDGIVARRTGQVSEWGKILDPIADKATAFFLFFYAVVIGRIPVWFFVVAIVRDVLIMAGSIYIQRTRGKVAMAVMSGKVSVNALAAYWISVFFFPEAVGFQLFFMGCSLALMLFSFMDYVHRFNLIHKGIDFN
jgi:phosphatidylglycerophosphate synthase